MADQYWMQWSMVALYVKWNSVTEVWVMAEGKFINYYYYFKKSSFSLSPDENGETTLDAMIMDG